MQVIVGNKKDRLFYAGVAQGDRLHSPISIPVKIRDENLFMSSQHAKIMHCGPSREKSVMLSHSWSCIFLDRVTRGRLGFACSYASKQTCRDCGNFDVQA